MNLEGEVFHIHTRGFDADEKAVLSRRQRAAEGWRDVIRHIVVERNLMLPLDRGPVIVS